MTQQLPPPTIELDPRDYRDAYDRRDGLRRWLYFARHPILAFMSYQICYPDPEPSFQDRQANAIVLGLSLFVLRRVRDSAGLIH